MNNFKVYFIFNNKADFAYVCAEDSFTAKWKILARFYGAVINKTVLIGKVNV